MKKRKWMISLGLSFILLVALAAKRYVARQDDRCSGKEQQSATPGHRSLFACNRLALDSEARKRHFDELMPALRAMRKAVRELPDGYEFEFPSDPKSIAMVAEWAAGERLCCPFFNIELRLEAEDGPFWLRLTGRKGTKEFIKLGAAGWINQ